MKQNSTKNTLPKMSNGSVKDDYNHS